MSFLSCGGSTRPLGPSFSSIKGSYLGTCLILTDPSSSSVTSQPNPSPTPAMRNCRSSNGRLLQRSSRNPITRAGWVIPIAVSNLEQVCAQAAKSESAFTVKVESRCLWIGAISGVCTLTRIVVCWLVQDLPIYFSFNWGIISFRHWTRCEQDGHAQITIALCFSFSISGFSPTISTSG